MTVPIAVTPHQLIVAIPNHKMPCESIRSGFGVRPSVFNRLDENQPVHVKPRIRIRKHSEHSFHENDDALKTTVDTLPDVTGLTPAGLLPAPTQINAPISTAKIFAAINVLPESDLRAIRDAIDKRLAITV